MTDQEKCGEFGEPWVFTYDSTSGYDCMWGAYKIEPAGIYIDTVKEYEPREETQRLPRRVVACVNACAGIPTYILENCTVIADITTYGKVHPAMAFAAIGGDPELVAKVLEFAEGLGLKQAKGVGRH
jgi:hypothetical protein